MKKSLILFLFLSSCGPEPCYLNFYANFTRYNINPDVTTPFGVQIESGGYEINVQDVDTVFDLTESCLRELAVKNYIPKSEAWCIRKLKDAPIKRECIKVKVVDPIFSECSDWHFLDIEAPQAQCAAKGLAESLDCPCRYRWSIQDDNNIITPPGHLGFLYLYPIVRIVTGCNNPWADPELSHCASLAGISS